MYKTMCFIREGTYVIDTGGGNPEGQGVALLYEFQRWQAIFTTEDRGFYIQLPDFETDNWHKIEFSFSLNLFEVIMNCISTFLSKHYSLKCF